MKKNIVEKNLLKKLGLLINTKQFSKIAILTDSNVAKNWLTIVSKSLNNPQIIIIKPGEKEKNIETVKDIWEKMSKNSLDRQSLLINLGGGVVCDIGGFAASTYIRGIEFINIPTTLLSMVDASVGGKTGVNLGEIKNGIGVFKNPFRTIIDINTLITLPKRELVAAFGEIIKHGIISGKKYFSLTVSKRPEEFNQTELMTIVQKSINMKLKIVEKDPNEKGLRKVLNLGHTIGHAIESLSWKTDKPLLHGEAVAIGIIGECKLAQLSEMLLKSDFKLIEKSVAKAGLPTNIKNITVKDVMKVILLDKKNNRGIINWSLPKTIGKVTFDKRVSTNLIVKALNHILI